MCGIAGVIAYGSNASSVSEDELNKLQMAMRSRGPDGKGIWRDKTGRAGLAHVRLAIIDPGKSGSQPMKSECGRYVISFNGEIYNYKELRKNLTNKGYRFKSNSDTEVLLALYSIEGPRMLTSLRGMFAFAIWDKLDKRIFLARDVYGIKPLYYSDNGNTFRFASQVKSLAKTESSHVKQDPAGVVGFYLFGSIPEPFTLYSNIKALPAGSYISFKLDGAVPDSIRYLSLVDLYKSAEEAAEYKNNMMLESDVHEAVRESLKYHFVADVEVGLFLSGGIDSCALLGTASDLGIDNIRTITIAFPEFQGKANDESIIARDVASYYNYEHIVRNVNHAEFEEEVSLFLQSMDQPTIDGLNTWFISKAAKELGLKVAISGIGGDELFGGYPSFLDVPKWRKLINRASYFIPMRKTLASGLATLHQYYGKIPPKLPALVSLGENHPGAYFAKRGLFMPWELSKFLDPDIVHEGLRALNPVELIRSHGVDELSSDYAKLSLMESTMYMRNQLLRDADWAGMSQSVEIRVPLVDLDLSRRCIPYLISTSLCNQKRVLANTPNKVLPSLVTEKSKTGFETPISNWIRSSKRFTAMENMHWSRSWARNIVECAFAG